MDIEALYRRYQQDGYVLLPGALDAASTATLRDTTDRVSAMAATLANDNDIFDLEPSHRAGQPAIQRIKKPHRVDPFYFSLATHAAYFPLVQRICGAHVRLNHSKMNMKTARAGAPLQWHQDWAFAPHTNMAQCVVSVMVDDVGIDNGPLQILPGSHRGRLYEHHDPELGFVGAVDIAAQGIDLSPAASLLGPAGTVAIHHPLALHGSSANTSDRPRRILFLEYAAADAYPLFYAVDWAEYNARLLTGPATSEVRFEPHYVKLPFPSRAGSSIYKVQEQARVRHFDAPAKATA